MQLPLIKTVFKYFPHIQSPNWLFYTVPNSAKNEYFQNMSFVQERHDENDNLYFLQFSTSDEHDVDMRRT